MNEREGGIFEKEK
uniref:Uncharacterized protein n=1 Tax=Arundo donax TaxID=35708 RepID=A0A0A8YKS2_ARUDO